MITSLIIVTRIVAGPNTERQCSESSTKLLAKTSTRKFINQITRFYPPAAYITCDCTIMITSRPTPLLLLLLHEIFWSGQNPTCPIGSAGPGNYNIACIIFLTQSILSEHNLYGFHNEDWYCQYLLRNQLEPQEPCIQKGFLRENWIWV